MSILSTKFITKNKECAKHILAPSAVACDISQLRASAHPRGAFLISRNELSHVSVTRSFLDIKNSACQRTHFGKNFLRNSCLTTTTLQQFPITKQKSTSRLSVLRHSSLFIYFKFLFGTKHYHSPAVQNKTSP